MSVRTPIVLSQKARSCVRTPKNIVEPSISNESFLKTDYDEVKDFLKQSPGKSYHELL
jgi:hypothetical protein